MGVVRATPVGGIPANLSRLNLADRPHPPYQSGIGLPNMAFGANVSGVELSSPRGGPAAREVQLGYKTQIDTAKIETGTCHTLPDR